MELSDHFLRSKLGQMFDQYSSHGSGKNSIKCGEKGKS